MAIFIDFSVLRLRGCRATFYKRKNIKGSNIDYRMHLTIYNIIDFLEDVIVRSLREQYCCVIYQDILKKVA